MRTRILFVAAAALLLFGTMPAQAQDVGIQNPNVSTPTTLYFHVINVQDMPINTQLPDPSFADDQGYSVTTPTVKCLHPVTGPVTAGTTSQVYHTAYGYSSPSYVEYDQLSASGDPRTHPERGISYDAEFDMATQPYLTWYVAVFGGGGQQDQLPTPGTGVVVAGTMKTGDSISIDDAGYDGGETIMEGRTEPAYLIPAAQGAFTASGQPHPQVTYVDGVQDKHIYEFKVPLELNLPLVQRSTGFNFRIDMFLDNPVFQATCSDPTGKDKQYFMSSNFVSYSSAESRPRLDFNIMNPIRLEYLHPQFVGDDLVVHTSMNSVWGNYDVDESSLFNGFDDSGIVVSIEGPSQATSLAQAALVQRYHEHYHHQEAVDITYVWPYKTDRASNGLYTVFVEFQNDQKTAKASGTAQFEIGKGTVIGCGGVQEASQRLNDDCAQSVQVDGQSGPEESPGLPVLAALGVLGAIAVALRRRQA